MPAPFDPTHPSRRGLLIAATALAATGISASLVRRSRSRKPSIVVQVELRGGNDALNTIVPVQDPLYRKARPSLALGADQVMDFAPDLVTHRALAPLLPAWRSGHLAVLHGVGIPGGDRSHFQARDQWSSGRLLPSLKDGWLGRVADATDTGIACISDGPMASALRANGAGVVLSRFDDVLVDPDWLAPDVLSDLASALGSRAEDRTLRDAIDLARREQGSKARRSTRVPTFAERIGVVSRLVDADYPASQYCVGIEGFDTHAVQAYRHSLLLGELAEGLAEFDRWATGRASAYDVLVLVTSEFGRRVHENHSAGTDHGLGGVVFVMGTSVEGGVHGPAPNLARLDDGDLPVAVDFRRVLADVARFRDTDPQEVLGSAAPIHPTGFLRHA